MAILLPTFFLSLRHDVEHLLQVPEQVYLLNIFFLQKRVQFATKRTINQRHSLRNERAATKN